MLADMMLVAPMAHTVQSSDAHKTKMLADGPRAMGAIKLPSYRNDGEAGGTPTEYGLLRTWNMIQAEQPKLNAEPSPAEPTSAPASLPWVPRLRRHLEVLEAPTYSVHNEAASYDVHLNPNRVGRGRHLAVPLVAQPHQPVVQICPRPPANLLTRCA